MTLSNPDTKAGRLQRACLDLLKQHESDDALPTNGHFLFYELEQAGVVPKYYLDENGRKRPRQPSHDITDALMVLREAGLIPWDWIEDETRFISNWPYADSVRDYLDDTIDSARIDLWQGSEPPLLICESAAVAGVLRNLAYRYLVPITGIRGQCGGFLVNEVVPLLQRRRRVLYIGDYELRGPADQIEANTRRRLEEHTDRDFGGDGAWERIALTKEQVESDPRLLSLVIEKEDRRYKPVKVYEAVECEAKGQNVLIEIIRAKLDDLSMSVNDLTQTCCKPAMTVAAVCFRDGATSRLPPMRPLA
jgi:hypothetical protein